MNRSRENTWRITKGQQPLKSMKNVVADLQKYIETYSSQPTYEEFSDEVFIDDIVYGLGVALSEEYKFAPGFSDFKEVLLKHLLSDPYLKNRNLQGAFNDKTS